MKQSRKDQHFEARWAEGVDYLGEYMHIILGGQAT